ncbi:YidB family protein [Streptomyces sp. NPDC002564]|uniref:YidB family protein n=2 Tax=unclassified Streptomyces TaxID=2593676 RepID=UPI0036AFB91B
MGRAGPAPHAKGTTMAGNDLGSLLGGLLGGGQQGGSSGAGGGGNILAALLGALMSKGGASGGNPLSGLLEGLNKAGLVDQAQSWVGTGENKEVTGEQVQQALPDDALRQAAEEAGVSPEQAANEIAQVLPQAVDKLTPEGQVPSGSLEDLIRQQQL